MFLIAEVPSSKMADFAKPITNYKIFVDVIIKMQIRTETQDLWHTNNVALSSSPGTSQGE